MFAGVKVRIMRAGVSPALWKQCTVPRGTLTKSPTPAVVHSPPRRKAKRPSTM
jgi:hypothetical protein